MNEFMDRLDRCTCGKLWWGIMPPPPCSEHPHEHAPTLSDADVERIAVKVAEILKRSQ